MTASESSEFEASLRDFPYFLPANLHDFLLRLIEDTNTALTSLLFHQQKCFAASVLSLKRSSHVVLPVHEQLSTSVFTTAFLTTREATPLVIQQASLMVPFIYANLDVFARAVIKTESSSLFGFVCNSAVPAIFGHFGCKEVIEPAATFYAFVIRWAKPSLAMKILKPFFCSLPTFRFIEAVMKPFVTRFGARVLKDGGILDRDQLVGLLLHGLVQCRPLIPREFLDFTAAMRGRGWTISEFEKMYAHYFLEAQLLRYFLASPFAKFLSAFKDILATVFQPSCLKMFFSGLIHVCPAFDVPCCYRSMGHNYWYCAMTAADAITVVKIMTPHIRIPYAAELRPYHDFPQAMRFMAFCVKVYAYPKAGTCMDEKYPALVSLLGPNLVPVCSGKPSGAFLRQTERLCDLEQFTNSAVGLRVISEWKAVADGFAVMMMRQDASWLRYPQTILEMKREKFLMEMKPAILERRTSLGELFGRLEQLWVAFLRSEKGKFRRPTVKNLGRAQFGILMEAVEEFRGLPNARFCRRFEILSGALRRVHGLTPDMKLVVAAVLLADCEKFLAVFLLFSGLVMKNPEFERFSDEQEMTIWAKCESFLVGSISESSHTELQAVLLELLGVLA
jgi:hypothetical protein